VDVFSRRIDGSYASYDNILDYNTNFAQSTDIYDEWPNINSIFVFKSSQLNKIGEHAQVWQQYRVTWVDVEMTLGRRIGANAITPVMDPGTVALPSAAYQDTSQCGVEVWYAIKRNLAANENFANNKWIASQVPGHYKRFLKTGGSVRFGFSPNELRTTVPR